jgi:hypothetical protein
MVTEAVVVQDQALAADGETGTGTAPAVRPFAPSWVDRLDAWIGSRPGPAWLTYLAIVAVAVAASVVEPVLDGADDPWVYAGMAFWGIVVPLSLWLVHHLSDVAGAAVDAFRPMLSASDAEAGRMRYAMTTIPARPAAAILVGSALITPLYYIADAEASGIVGLSQVGMVLRWASESFFGALIMVLLYQTVRQLQAVSRIHASATRVDLFRPAPLYAFSVLTSRAAAVIALLFLVPTVVAAAQTPVTERALLIVLPWLVLGIAAAALVFSVPLWGMRRRIVEEKGRLQGEVGRRIDAAIKVMHERIDAGDPAGARAQHDVLQALVMERDLVDKLPTLPWRPGAVGAVVSAVIAPLSLFVATRLLERVI